MTFLDPSGGPGRPKRETEGDFFKSDFEDMSAAEKFAGPAAWSGVPVGKLEVPQESRQPCACGVFSSRFRSEFM